MADFNHASESPVLPLALRPREAATALGISERTLFAWTNDPNSGIPVIRIGNVVLYPVREAQDWLAAQAKKEEVTRE